ncbi:MAG: inositol-3-phosphate synthase [Planctomycetota bacterium]|nr:inositol-3-phosphate synthase [Planctomycetota bacterium]MDA1113869.1 inositol-3-phosphate synthase [Planctomycetota bacterium]
MNPDPEKTGLFLVGVRGAVGTTVLHGIEAIRSGMPAVGMVTGGKEFASVPLADVERFWVTGWDVAGDAHHSAEDLVRTGVLPEDLVELSAGLRDRLEMSIAPGVPEPEDERLVNRASADRLQLTAGEMVDAIRGDIRGWMQMDRTRKAVVVYLASAERERDLPEQWNNPEADVLKLLKNAPLDISRSILYAIAAIAEGVPFVNFTPAPGAGIPVVAAYARKQGVPVLGNDGKTGETLMKTALAPMFRDRRFNVMAWEGYNMLGNKDGAALVDPKRAASKLANKDKVLGGILHESPGLHSGVRIDFVPSLHDWKTAMDFVHFEGFLGAKMQLQFTWQGSDSALAAPLILDLARIALLAQARGQGGVVHAAAAFFKNPLEFEEHDFHRQMDLLRKWMHSGA